MVQIKNNKTKEILDLTKEQYERFFDNRSPFDWTVILIKIIREEEV